MGLSSILSTARRVMPAIINNNRGLIDHEQPTTLIFVSGHFDDSQSMPAMADGNQIGSFALKYYPDQVSFEKCLKASLKNQEGEITALLIDEANSMNAVIPLGNAQSICTASLIAQCNLFQTEMLKQPRLVN